MEQERGAAGGFVSLTQREQRYYAALHSRCQADSSGTLSGGKVTELLAASGLPPESLYRVTELCGAKRLGFFTTPQFFVALKLLAAVQSERPLQLESITANLPLPRFSGLKNEPEMRHAVAPPSADGQGGQTGTGTRTPADRRHPEDHVDRKASLSSSSARRNDSLSVQDTIIVCESQLSPPLLPPAYESRSMVPPELHSSPGGYGTRAATTRTSSWGRLDQQGLVDSPDEDPWRITEEQQEYYTNQFQSLQPDLGALVLGTIAKNFFTKSKLPIPELSHIWELSDVDRDGALSFPEFCTAFHLIVARKNGLPLPERLPPPLRAGPLVQDPPDPPEDLSAVERLQPGLTSTTRDVKEESRKQDVTVKTMTSQEKRILRLGAFTERPDPPQDLDPHMRTRTRPRSYSSTSIEDAVKKAEEPPPPPPRPQKTHSRASSLDLNKLLQQGAPGMKSVWLPAPPALPPRPSASQVSHFVVDVSEKSPQNKVLQPDFADFSHFREEEEGSVTPEDQGPSSGDQQVPEAVPPSQVKPVRRKHHAESQNLEATPTRPAQRLPSNQKRAVQTAIRQHKESRAVLRRLNGELQQQLEVVHQERVALETQLELQRPQAST
ncbi:ralBP1-associated Eps domain-containing protein 2 isoform X2 [Pseudoliparis swirei]|uniref:ralBP1-associated Eps domain-containing protein 2 isoform X2 n=1 Tax=Pseudoliparis swirei TaxID=2059687 RepID=UPI0024BDA9D6|nr:ralBP1-associated Eps domain-containing protein 2 isoform X2 [Pseudoliparis swirei]